MADEQKDRSDRAIPSDIEDPDFQRRWLEASDLDSEQVEAAWRHGFEARERFADRPFGEVRDYLRQSWDAMGPSVEWERVADVIESGYERHKGAGFGITDAGPEALENFDRFTSAGGHTGPGELGERPQTGDGVERQAGISDRERRP